MPRNVTFEIIIPDFMTDLDVKELKFDILNAIENNKFIKRIRETYNQTVYKFKVGYEEGEL